MSNLAEIIKITKEIGLEGDDLKSFVKEKAFLTDVPGKTKVIKHVITLNNSRPIRTKPYPENGW